MPLPPSEIITGELVKILYAPRNSGFEFPLEMIGTVTGEVDGWGRMKIVLATGGITGLYADEFLHIKPIDLREGKLPLEGETARLSLTAVAIITIGLIALGAAIGILIMRHFQGLCGGIRGL